MPWQESNFSHKIKEEKKSLTIQLPFWQVCSRQLYLTISFSGDKKREKPADVLRWQSEGIWERLEIFLSNYSRRASADIRKNETKNNSNARLLKLTWKILSLCHTRRGTKDPITKNELYERLPI